MASLIFALMLVVRIYDTTGLSGLDRADAVTVASGILAAAGVSTAWPDCGAVAKPEPRNGSPCSRPIDSGELAVRIVDGGLAGRGQAAARADRQPLGYSLVDRNRGGGLLATVYLDRIGRMAAAAAVPMPVLLGRAVAHEIGHLLLGNNSHAAEGLMRPVWSQAMLRAGVGSDWLFTDAQAIALRRLWVTR